MKIVRGSELDFVPASHEDPKNPGSLKKVLVGKDDLVVGRVMMINWAKLPVGKAFEAHYHEDLDEVFVIMSGEAEIKVGDEVEKLKAGDAVVIPMKSVHVMVNTGKVDVEYIALGVSSERGGKTVNV